LVRRALRFFAEPPWNDTSPKWVALDRELAADHPVRMVDRQVDEVLNLEALRRTYAGRGTRAHPPEMLLKLLVYEHGRERMQPVQWLKDLEENKAVQWLVRGLRPSRSTLYEFRDRMSRWVDDLNKEVLETAIAEGHTDGLQGALDGTTVAANATRHRMINLATALKRLEILNREIAQVKQAEEPPPLELAEAGCAASSTATPTAAVAEDSTKPPSWMAKTPRGKERQRERYRNAIKELKIQNKTNDRRRKDKRKESAKIKVAPGDPMAPFGLDKLKTYRPLYNVQTMCDVQTDLVLAYATTRTTTDSGQLLPMLEQTMEMTGRPLQEVLVDSGYPSGEDLARCKEKGITVYAPWNENAFTEAKRAKKRADRQIPKDQFTFDHSKGMYRCPEGKPLSYRERTTKQKANGIYFAIEIYEAEPADCAACPLKAQCVRGKSGARTVRRQEHEELIEELKERMRTAAAKERYRQRSCTVERRFADWKTYRGLHRFSGQTPERAATQIALIVLAHNLRTLTQLRTRATDHMKNTEKIAA
jgi:transposase